VTGYHGGESLKPFSADPQDGENFFNPQRLVPNSASVFAMVQPAGSLRGPNSVARSHDIRGRFDDALIEGRLSEATRIAVSSRPHHPSALFYNVLFKFGNLRTVGPDDADYFKVRTRAHCDAHARILRFGSLRSPTLHAFIVYFTRYIPLTVSAFSHSRARGRSPLSQGVWGSAAPPD